MYIKDIIQSDEFLFYKPKFKKIFMAAQNLSNPMTVVGLVNGMIGGIILVMPILALKTGTLLIAPITLIFGFFSYFSCELCLRHLRNYEDLDQAVLRHFNNKRRYKIIYDVIIIISLSVLLILYFGLICDMWVGMTEQSPLIPILNALVLFPIVYVMKKFHFGASLLAYGILSIIGYCIFLTWMWASAPQGQKTVPLTDDRFVELGAALAQGFAIQTFFIPILKQNPNRKLYKKLLLLTYGIGTLVYSYIGYSGSQSIINLVNQNKEHEAEEIGDFFGDKQWQVILLEIIYLVHLYSAFPEFLLIAKKRFFSIFKQPETTDVTIKDVVYVGATIFVCLVIRMTSVSPQFLIEVNGSIVSFFFIYVIPITLHIKCVYFTKPQDRIHKKKDENQQHSSKTEGNHHRQQQMQPKMQSSQIIRKQIDENMKKSNINESMHEKDQEIMSEPMDGNDKVTMNSDNDFSSPANNFKEYDCCDITFRNKAQENCEKIIIVLMILMGLFTMGYTLFLLIKGDKEDE